MERLQRKLEQFDVMQSEPMSIGDPNGACFRIDAVGKRFTERLNTATGAGLTLEDSDLVAALF